LKNIFFFCVEEEDLLYLIDLFTRSEGNIFLKAIKNAEKVTEIKSIFFSSRKNICYLFNKKYIFKAFKNAEKVK